MACWPLLVGMMLLLMLGTVSRAGAQAQTASSGKDFYIAYPSLALVGGQALRVNITAVRASSVEMVFMEDNATTRVLLDAGEVHEMVIPAPRLMLNRDEYVSRRTLHITSTDLITVHVVNDAHALSDGYTALPTSALGFEYMAMSYTASPQNDLYRGMLAVIATEDQTDVRITPTVHTLGGNMAGAAYSRRLNRGEVYQILSSAAGAADITGTRVRSNKPVVLLSGHESTTVQGGTEGAANSLLEAMTPVVDWGETYYALPLAGAREGLFRVIALRDGTELYVNDRRVATLAAGGTHEFKADGGVQIRGTGPLLAAQFLVHSVADTVPGGDPSMMILNPAEFYADAFSWTTPPLSPRSYTREDDVLVVPFRHYAVITASSAARSSVRLDGGSVELPIPHAGGAYYSGIVEIEPGAHRLTASGGVNAQLFGVSEYDAYSMPAGVHPRAPLRGAPLAVRTCLDSLDTTLLLSNVSTGAVEIIGVEFPPDIGGSLRSPPLPMVIPAAAEQALRLRFAGLPFGTRSGTIAVRSSAGGASPLLIPIRITRDSSAMRAVEETILFPSALTSAPRRDTTITIVNTGGGPITVAEARATGPFSVLAPPLPQTIAEGDTLRLAVRFNPLLPGEFTGAITLLPSPCGNDVTVQLRGRKLSPATIEARGDTLPPLICSDPPYQDLPVTIYNSGEEELLIDSVVITGVEPGEFTLPAPQNGSVVAGEDSLVVMVRFRPAGYGVRSAVARIWTRTAPGGYLVLPLKGIRERAELAASVSLLDFGGVQGCDSIRGRSLRITNSGSIPLRIDSLVVSGGDFLPRGERSFQLGTDQARDIEIAFAPRGSGGRRDTLRIYGTCGLLAAIELAGEQRGADLRADVDTLDFGTLPLCGLPARGFFRIANTGAVADTLLSIEMEGDGFTIGSPGAPELAVGEERLLEVVFDAAATGTFQSVVVLRAAPCTMIRRVMLRGSVVDLIPPRIGDLLLNGTTPVRRTATVSNSNPFPLSIDRLEFQPEIPGLRLIAPSLPLQIPAGGSAELELEYDGTAGFQTEATLLTGDSCALRSVFRITREEERQTIAVELLLPDTSATVDRTIIIPLRVISSSPYQGNGTVAGELRWDRTMLAPQRLTTPVPGGSIVIISDTIDGPSRALRFSYIGPVPANGTLALLEALVLLGTSDTTALRIIAPRGEGENGVPGMEVTGRGGFFRTLGICRIGGDRFIRLWDMGTLSAISPNPASTSAVVRFRLPADAPVLIRLFDLMGREVARPVDGYLPAGSHEARLDLRMLSSGPYSCELRIGSGTFRETMMIRK